MKNINVYFKSKSELELHQKIRKYAKNQKISLSQAIILMLTEGDQTVKELTQEISRTRQHLADVQAIAQVYRVISQIKGPLSKEIEAGMLTEEMAEKAIMEIGEIIERYDKQQKETKDNKSNINGI
jgi:hypothetical protein